MENSPVRTERIERVLELRRQRPRSWFLRVSWLIALAMIAWAWASSGPLLGRLSAERRRQNFLNFCGELVPSPVQKSGNWLEAFPWAWELLAEDGFIALLITVGIATAAIILAGAFVLPLLPLASRQLARPGPFGVWPGRGGRIGRIWWRLIGPATRFGFVLCRAIPEYLIAFLLLSLIGAHRGTGEFRYENAWPLVLALAIHNLGILGRLWGEVVENADGAAPTHGIASGGSRSGVYATRVLPAGFNRFLIYFFYRWETCVKDATVLGMLGLLTLGKLIALSKGFFWDEMFFYILLGSAVILVGDLFSTYLRKRLR